MAHEGKTKAVGGIARALAVAVRVAPAALFVGYAVYALTSGAKKRCCGVVLRGKAPTAR